MAPMLQSIFIFLELQMLEPILLGQPPSPPQQQQMDLSAY